MRRRLVSTALLAWALLTAGPASAADLRDLTLGMKLAALPRDGYGDFTCAGAAPGRRIADWSEYSACPADAIGLHQIGFKFTSEEDTKIGGQLVLLTAMLGEDGTLAGLRVVTDPKVPLYMHKKGHLLANQARAHYGEEGWTCIEAEPTANEQPIGPAYHHETCTKNADGRRFTVTRELYRDPAKPLREFVSRSELTIMATPG